MLKSINSHAWMTIVVLMRTESRLTLVSTFGPWLFIPESCQSIHTLSPNHQQWDAHNTRVGDNVILHCIMMWFVICIPNYVAVQGTTM